MPTYKKDGYSFTAPSRRKHKSMMYIKKISISQALVIIVINISLIE